MASIKVKFRPSQKENNEGILYYQIIHNRMVRQVKTDFKINSSEWNEKDDNIIIEKNSSSLNHLKSIQYQLKCDQQKFEQIFASLEKSQPKEQILIDELVSSFEQQLAETTLFNFMKNRINIFQQNGQIRTAETYQTTLNSFKRFRNMSDLPLNEINSEIMESYQCYLKHHNVSMNTISFYMRRMRATFNRAVEQDLANPTHPFKHVYTGMDKSVKRAISVECMKAINSLNLKQNAAQNFSRDIFILSFYLHGMSFIDMAYLRKSDLKNGILTYRRKKTGQKLIIQWEDCMQKLVDKYQTADSPFLLSILKLNDEDLRKQYQKALSNINRNLKNIGKDIGLKAPLTMYVSRHSWASIARWMNIPLSIISEGLGHDNEVTTSIYLSTVGTEAIDNANKKIIDLL